MQLPKCGLLCGFLISYAVMLFPISLPALFLDSWAKRVGIVGGPLYLRFLILPAIIAFVSATISAVLVYVLGRRERVWIGLYFWTASVPSLVLLLSFCFGWAEWYLSYAEHFRPK
jgi:hypothetical protein